MNLGIKLQYQIKYFCFSELDTFYGSNNERTFDLLKIYLYLQTLCNLSLNREFLSLSFVDPDEIRLGLGTQPAKFRFRHSHSMHIQNFRTRKIVVRRYCAKMHRARLKGRLQGEAADIRFDLEPLTHARVSPCQRCLKRKRQIEVVCVSRLYETIIHS